MIKYDGRSCEQIDVALYLKESSLVNIILKSINFNH